MLSEFCSNRPSLFTRTHILSKEIGMSHVFIVKFLKEGVQLFANELTRLKITFDRDIAIGVGLLF